MGGPGFIFRQVQYYYVCIINAQCMCTRVTVLCMYVKSQLALVHVYMTMNIPPFALLLDKKAVIQEIDLPLFSYHDMLINFCSLRPINSTVLYL